MNTKQLILSVATIGCLFILMIIGITINGLSKEQSSPLTTRYLNIEKIDGCEYVFYKNYGGITHHDACDNPIHKLK